ncbi:MAG: NTP transferase domain-containing protein [Nocardioidaceae bacterium]|nr:NTP transferase domain-containing protein [Nocardioidaceae bacterium]
MVAYDAVVVAGGRGTRLGGVDKGKLDVGGRSLLSRALEAVVAARQTVVVGPSRPLPPEVVGTTEDPVGGGPAAALAAGLARVDADIVVALACDMPFLTNDHVTHLVEVVGDNPAADGAVLVDPAGRRQPLAAAYRTVSLRAAYDALGDPHGASMWALTNHLTLIETRADSETTLDCDTWADVVRSRDILEER